MNIEKIKEIIVSKQIKWIQIHFTDLIGGLRVLHTPASRFLKDDLISKGTNFDGSSVGFRKVDKSDMIALPDPETFKILPYEKDEAMIRADLYDTEYNTYRAGPRNILKKAVSKLKEVGYDRIMISPEMEFCSFNKSSDKEEGFKRNHRIFFSSTLGRYKRLQKRII